MTISVRVAFILSFMVAMVVQYFAQLGFCHQAGSPLTAYILALVLTGTYVVAGLFSIYVMIALAMGHAIGLQGPPAGHLFAAALLPPLVIGGIVSSVISIWLPVCVLSAVSSGAAINVCAFYVPPALDYISRASARRS